MDWDSVQKSLGEPYESPVDGGNVVWGNYGKEEGNGIGPKRQIRYILYVLSLSLYFLTVNVSF